MKKVNWIIPLLISCSVLAAPLDPKAKLEVMFRIPVIDGSNERPFAAVWIEDAQRQVVRTILLSANNTEWLPELRHYWRKVGGNGPDYVDGLTSATRPSGNYRLTWDGNDEDGNRMEQGDYTFYAEVVREDGGHDMVRQRLTLSDKPVVYVIEPTKETGRINMSYQFR